KSRRSVEHREFGMNMEVGEGIGHLAFLSELLTTLGF
ncbi:MAG: hypothetical protein ACI9ME_000001, partial [Ilumatobacter sp.]